MRPMLPGFTVNDVQLYSGLYTIVFSGTRNTDKVSVVIKLLKNEHPSPDDIARFKHEYEVAKTFESEEDIVHVYSLEKHDNSYAIIMENIHAPTLEEILEKEKKFKINEFLELAIHITEALGHIHQNNIIHKDINPSNIMCDYANKSVRIIDFGLSANLPKERAEIVSPNVLEGTLTYLSPEQTGRMNRGIDYRTDYYSLGVTFYQMLTGELPFSCKDPMELVHYHIAVIPKSPSEIDPTIPEVVSAIVMKLLAKKAEDRYQNANGLLADLKKCQEQLRATGEIRSFKLGTNDIFSRFQIPEKLYGRENEINILMNSYEKIMQGKTELMLVAGYSGIGKSALVHEIHKPIVTKHGYFISGKYDQFKHNIPYAALNQAFDEFVKQILTESEERIESVRQKIIEAVGENGQIIVDVIPNLAAIIGPQQPVAELGPTESQNRFSYVFHNFISAIASKDHPLVLFLDDLQWVDLPSLKMLETLLTSAECRYLLIIGAYRNNEVNANHPLMTALEEIKKRRVEYQTIELSPLAIGNVTELLADTLHQDHTSVQPLATMCFEKTAGNPFFLIQLLLALYKEQLIEFESRENRWVWHLDQIKERGITDNVVQLMINKIKELTPAAQLALKFAACIGNRFNLDILSKVSGKAPEAVLVDLQEPLKEGYIVSHGVSYRAVSYHFAHDRIQQAAYSLIEERERGLIHLDLARLILDKTTEEKLDDVIFDIVDHYNKCIDAEINDAVNQTEKRKIAQLNLQASKVAKSAAAFEPSLRYVEHAIKCIDEEMWEQDYDFMRDLYTEATEAAFLNAKFDLMEKYSDVGLKKIKNIIDGIKITKTKIYSYIAQVKPVLAIDTAVDILAKLGTSLPNYPNQLHILKAVFKVKFYLMGKKIPDILNRPEMTDPNKKAAIDLLITACSPSYFSRPNLLPILICTAIVESLRYGNTKGSAYTYVVYGMISCGILGEIDTGYQLGEMSLKLMEKTKEEENRTKISVLNCIFIRHWKDSIQEIAPRLIEIFELGLDSGDLEYACYSILHYDMNSFISSIPLKLKELLQKIELHRSHINTLQQINSYNFLSIFHQAILNLINPQDHPEILVGTAFDEEKMFPDFLEKNDKTALFCIYFNKLILLCIFDKPLEAVKVIGNCDLYSEAQVSTFLIPTYQFYKGLAALAAYSLTSSDKEKRKFKKIAKSVKSKMAKWAKFAPANHEHRFYLLEAEFARIHNETEKAAEFYDKAIIAAKRNEFLSEEALANEVAAKFYLAQGKEKIARIYMEDAHHCYLVWGADAKAKLIEKNYPQILMQNKGGLGSIEISVSTSGSNKALSEVLDMSTIQKSSQAISSTIILSDLLKKLMKIVIENAGAQKSYLLLNKDGKFLIEAQGSVGQEEASVLTSIAVAPDILPVSIVNYVIHANESVVLDNAMRSDRFMNDPYITATQPKSILCMPLLNQGALSGILYLENNLTEGAFTKDRISILNMLSSQTAMSIDNARLYSNTKDLNERLIVLNTAYERFVPHDFLSLLEKNSITDVGLGDQVQKTMSVLFSDIRSFTTLSEKMTPEENFKFINSFLGVMGPIIRKHHGFVDKYIGDAIMALYPRSPDDALQCAIEMQSVLDEYNKQHPGQEPVRIGVGINTGSLMLGTVGEHDRMNATVISDAVNIASRIESLTKNYKTPILISEDTYKSLKNPARYHIEMVDDQVLVKGKTKPIAVYKVE